MQDDFDRNDPAEKDEEELPPGMHVVTGEEKDEDLEEASAVEDPEKDLDKELDGDEIEEPPYGFGDDEDDR